MRIVSKSPCRVDMAGGTLDIWPLYLFHDNSVTVNFAVNRYTTATVTTLDTPHIVMRSRDLNAEASYASFDELHRAPKHKLSLIAYILKFFRPPMGLDIETHSEAPAGAGISGSSSLMITLSSAMNKLLGTGYSIEKIREIAQNIEAQIIRVPTGAQDYYPAMYGGVSAIDLSPAGVIRHPIPVDLDDFNQRIVLAYTGEPRNSGINNWEVTKAHIDGDKKVFRNFEHIAAIANGMRHAVAKADWTEAGLLLREEWSNRRKNAPGITTPLIDQLIASTRKAGALGAKVCGAGGGGCVFFLVDRGAKPKVSAVIQKLGATVLPVTVAPSGVTVKKLP